jgi:RNA polymerase sigma factor (sigma-70 family)
MSGYFSKKKSEELFESETALWDAFRNGNEAAYAYIYQQYCNLLYSYGNKISTDAALVEDCIQDLFIKLWVNKSNLGGTQSVKNYLLKAFRRMLKDAVQKNNLKQETSEQELDFKLTLSCESDNWHRQMQLDKEDQLQLAIEKLSSRQKEVIYLRFYKEMKNEEIAEVMAISVPSVYNLVSKALSVLESHLYHLAILLISHLIIHV